MIRSYKFRLYPTKTQKAQLSEMLGTFRWLYNRALEERRDGWKNYGWRFTYFDQNRGLTVWRRQDERLGRYSARSEMYVLKRLDEAFKGFFRRVAAGEKPGYPRFKSADRFNSARFDFGCGSGFDGSRVRLQAIEGTIRMKRHRDMPANPTFVTLKREGAKWFLVCQVESAAKAAPSFGNPVGVDAGLTSIVALTTGETVPTPQFTAKASKRIRRHCRALARAKKDSIRRRKARERLAGAHRKAARQRADFLHKLSRRIVDSHPQIAVEDLSVSQMTHSNLGKATHNAAWATLRNMLTYKAEDAGGLVVAVDPRGTSQTCSACGEHVPKTLKERQHDCPHCGLSICRDINAARNILARANFPPGTGGQTVIEPVAA